MALKFLSGNEAFAEGIRLARPRVVAAYPITPQTTVAERLAEMAEDKSLDCEFIHVESEHSALSCAMGASAGGVRTFTATSSQGLLYMAECLYYASGGRFPIVMMNANRSTALPWNIYGDQRDSLSQLDCGWLQVYAGNAQEALDLALMSYRIAEDRAVSLPIMVNLDGFILTHTYEQVDIPTAEQADKFLPELETDNKFDFDEPKNMAFSAGPEINFAFIIKHHNAMINSAAVIQKAEAEFGEIFGRKYPGLIEEYKASDADYIIITLGSVGGLCREAADKLREKGIKAGAIRIRYMRPFPRDELARAVKNARAVGVLEKDISFGNEGTVFTNVNSALQALDRRIPSYNFIGGLGGKSIMPGDIEDIFNKIISGTDRVNFIGTEAQA